MRRKKEKKAEDIYRDRMMVSVDRTQDSTIPTRQDNTKAIRDGIPGRHKFGQRWTSWKKDRSRKLCKL